MDDLKIGFKKWLQENFSKSTAYGSFSLVQKIFDKNFENSENWKEQSERVIPLLVRYFEFANREYYLDRVFSTARFRFTVATNHTTAFPTSY